MERQNILIGGAWPYANYFMHIGHLAALLPGDVLAKYFRGKGDNVIYVSGTDCHGTPITLRAKKENVSPESISNTFHEGFVETFNLLNFSYTLYTRTSTDFHKKAAGQRRLFLLPFLEKSGILSNKRW